MTLSCELVKEALADGEHGAELTAHLRTCEACSAFSASLDAIDAELESLPRIDAPDALVEKTLARAEAEGARAGAPLIVSSPSILVAAFAVLTAALGALVVAPLTFLQWIARAVPAGRAAPPGGAPLRDAGHRGFMPRLGPTFAVASSLCAVLFFMTWQRFGSTVKTKSRGAEAVVNGLPTGSYDEGVAHGDRGDFWGFDEPSVAAAPSTPTASASVAPVSGAMGGEGEALDRGGRGRYGIEGPSDLPPEEPLPTGAFATLLDTSGGVGDEIRNVEMLDGLEEGRDGDGRRTLADVEGSTRVERGLGWQSAGDDDEQSGEVLHRGELRALDGSDELSTLALESPPPLQAGQSPTLRLPAGGPGYFEQDGIADRDRTLEVDGLLQDFRGPSTRWLDAHRTTGLTFAAHDGWWENTYVPGDAAMRVLHARLAAAGDRRLSGVSFSPLSLAETTSPTVPAVAAPTERAVAVGVHADVAAIEGPTRVRMEVAIRGIAQAAGRRGALRIALVVDARDGLDAGAQGRIRSIVTALSRSAGSRDRVMLVAAGPHGGTLVELGAMRAGQIEIALRHLFAGDGTTDAATLQTAVESALEGVASDDGAGLVLLATPDGEHDAALDQALHVGAIAGVVTSAVGISGAVALSDLDAIALAGQGRRCLVLSESDATRAVRSELTAAARLVARALRVRVRLAPGVELIDVIGSRALDAEESRRTRETERAIDQQLARRLGIGADRDDDQDGIRILLPSFYSGDSHTVMLDLLVTRPGPVADVDVQFKDLVRLGNGSVSSALTLASGTSPRGPHEERVVASYIAHEVASALETAGDRVALGDWTGARASIEEARALIGAARSEVPGLRASPSVQADDALLGRYLTALSGGDPALVADSLHYAAHRRLVLPQLATSDP